MLSIPPKAQSDRRSDYFDECCFPRPAGKKIPHVGLPEGPPSESAFVHPVDLLHNPAYQTVFKSLALLRILKERLSTPVAPSPPQAIPPTPVPQPLLLPSRSLFASSSTLEMEYNLRCQLVSRRRTDNDASRCTKKPGVPNTCVSPSRKCSQAARRPLSNVANVANLPRRTQ